MHYEKPQITHSCKALTAVRGQNKAMPPTADAPQNLTKTAAAYEADE